MLGQLNQRAQVLALTLTPDGGGGYSQAWETIATVWARLEPFSGSRSTGDTYVSDHLQSRPAYRITVRRAGFYAAGQRLVVGTRSFWLRSIHDPGPPEQFIILYTEEIA